MRIALLISLLFFIFTQTETSTANETLDATRTLIQKWVRTEQLISLEKKQWKEEKTSINDIIKILSAEQRILNRQIKLAQEIASRADRERTELVATLTTYKEASSYFGSKLSDYERQIILINPYLPKILQKELSPKIVKIKALSEEVNVSLSERAQTVMNIMSEIDKFDRKITLTTETRLNKENEEFEVRVLYFGLSKAFYVDQNSVNAGFGVPSETGWQWQENNALSKNILNIINVFEARKSPEFISLPMKVEK